MRLRPALIAALLALSLTVGGVSAASPGTNYAAAKPSVRITSAWASSDCITVKVAVYNFKLVKPSFIRPRLLKGNQGSIHYVLNGARAFNPFFDITTALSHTWCGRKQGVLRGHNNIQVFLGTTQHRIFPGTKMVSRTVRVK